VQISWKVICIVAGDINLPWKHCCATLITLRSWQWHVNNNRHAQSIFMFPLQQWLRECATLCYVMCALLS